MNELGPVIRSYAYGDEDLTQEGFIALREALVENIRAPPSHLQQAAKYAICGAYSRGKSVDSRKSEVKASRDRRVPIELVRPDFQDSHYLEDAKRYRPDVMAIDKVTYEAFHQSLTERESYLLRLIRSAYNSQNGRSAPYRDVFMNELDVGRWVYEKTNAALRMKFYRHFGEEYEAKRFEARNEAKLRAYVNTGAKERRM